jgi:hypothetical protein
MEAIPMREATVCEKDPPRLLVLSGEILWTGSRRAFVE